MSYVQSTLPVEYVRVEGDHITPALLIWRRYKRPYPNMLEIMLDLNPHIAEPLSKSPFLAYGTIVQIPIDQNLLAGKAPSLAQISLTGGDE